MCVWDVSVGGVCVYIEGVCVVYVGLVCLCRMCVWRGAHM